MLRIIGGENRGRKLFSLKGLHLRPTGDRVREALFDVLQQRIRDTRVLELFAGSGAVGLEALSRGACYVTFVERDAHTCRLIERNIAGLGYQDHAEVRNLDAFKALAKIEPEDGVFDMVFIDPPYELFHTPSRRARILSLLEDLGEAPWFEEGGLVILQHTRELTLPERQGPLYLVKQKRYGRTGLAFYERDTGQSRTEGANLG